MQNRIIAAKNLLDKDNNIIEPGYCTDMLPIYNKKTDLISRFKTKEWDYYYIGNQNYGLALTIADNGYMGLDSVSFLDFNEKWEITKSPMQFMTLGKKNHPRSSLTGDLTSKGKNYALSFINKQSERILQGYMHNFQGNNTIKWNIKLTDVPDESIVICTPFNKKGCFYYNQKINCMKACGTVMIGEKNYDFSEKTTSVLDWGRGIWTYDNTWYWSSLSCYVNNVPFGFNLGYGFGNTSAASENMLFYDGKAYKLDQVDFGLPQVDNRDHFYGIWHFTDNNNQLDLRFEPILDRANRTNALIIESDQHQVFGKFYGQCKLDDTRTITLDGQLGFAEKVRNRW
ncbi:MAG: DUF2804 domain-containing protein [Erysipelotrichia bacterium]|nr:DUF2804 domain-containing protein [Erysipelotrichia bacterium]